MSNKKLGTLFVCDIGFKPYLTMLFKNDFAFFSGPTWREYQVNFDDNSRLTDLLQQVATSVLKEFDTEEIWHFRIDWHKSSGFEAHHIFSEIWKDPETACSAIYNGNLENVGHLMSAVVPNNFDCQFTPNLTNGLGTIRNPQIIDSNIEDYYA
tara:strand:- start:246 stop:704 length:459 start_codon:yes stop_codon:yes gene_type:complete